MTIESTFVETPYGRFHAESAGSGTPVLFLHGGTASSREWRPVLGALGRHARCVAVDRLGCGDSDRSARGYDRDTVTRSLLACADALGMEKFGVVGQSFGGFWALSMAFAAPARVSRLVLVNSAGGPMTDDEREAWRARTDARRQATTAADTLESRGEAADRTIATIFADPRRVPPTFRDDLLWQMERADPGQLGALGDGFEGMGRERYDRISCPTLVVWGEADSMIPLDRGRRLAAAIPGARYAGLPGVGHTCQIEDPEGFVAAVAPFLEETAGVG